MEQIARNTLKNVIYIKSFLEIGLPFYSVQIFDVDI